jgi:hypothetical protein
VTRSQLLRGGAALCAAVALGGCSWTASLKARETTVYFVDGATPAQQAAARSACSGLPHTTPEPIATDALSRRAHTEIRFRVDDANDNELAALYACLQKQPGYRAVATEEINAGNGG